ncbi:NUDIX hydrolase [Candidatus Parcubacteria bacterium]|nr:NUDIX hydrolase [Candidatus Parcubacteria bacterium]
MLKEKKPTSPHSSRMVISHPENKDGEAQILLLKCQPFPNKPEDVPWYEIPGGDYKPQATLDAPKETPEETAKRETREETGLKIPQNAPIEEFYLEILPSGHKKHGFHVTRKCCKGKRHKTPRNDGNKRILENDWFKVSDALALIQPGEDGRTQYDILLEFQQFIAGKSG